MQRKVKISGTNLVVSVPIYNDDWVKFLAVDKDGEIWMFQDEPFMGQCVWQSGKAGSDLDRLPEEGSDRPRGRMDMTGVQWSETLTSVTAAIAKEKTGLIDEVCHQAAGIYRASSEEAAQEIINEIRRKLEVSL